MRHHQEHSRFNNILRLETHMAPLEVTRKNFNLQQQSGGGDRNEYLNLKRGNRRAF